MPEATSDALQFVKKHPRALSSAAVVVLALMVAGWIAWTDFAQYQLELREASNGAFHDARDIREIDVQEHIAGFTYGLLLFTTFGFLLSIGTLFFLAWTLRETRSMAIETRNMVRQSAADADEARQLSHAQYRAYVRAEEAHLQKRDGRYELRVKYKNAGQSPALYVHHRTVVKTRNLKPGGPPTETFGNSNVYSSKRPILPDDSDTYTYEVPSYPDASAKLRAGQAVTFVGDVIYRDVFGRWLRTEFEFYLDEKHAVIWTTDYAKPIRLSWGRRGPGGVYELVEIDKEPADVQNLLRKLSREAVERENTSQVPN